MSDSESHDNTRPSGRHNPSYHLALPEDIAGRDGNISRPAVLPPSYDFRVHTDDIFLLHQSSEAKLHTPPRYITRVTCKHCRYSRHFCDKGYPCGECKTKALLCERSPRRWNALSLKKVEKPSLRKKGNSSTKPLSKAAESFRKKLRPRGRALLPLPSSGRKGNARLPSPKHAKALSTDSEKISSSVSPGTESYIPLTIRLATADISRALSRIDRKRKSEVTSAARKRVAKTSPSPPGNAWQAIKVPLGEHHDRSKMPLVRGSPRIWASTKEELIKVLPGLTSGCSGISWQYSETPVVFVEGPRSRGDCWDGGKTIFLSMYREVTVVSSERSAQDTSLPPVDSDPREPMSVDRVDQEMHLVTEQDVEDLGMHLESSFQSLPTPSLVTDYQSSEFQGQESREGSPMPSSPLSSLPSSPVRPTLEKPEGIHRVDRSSSTGYSAPFFGLAVPSVHGRSDLSLVQVTEPETSTPLCYPSGQMPSVCGESWKQQKTAFESGPGEERAHLALIQHNKQDFRPSVSRPEDNQRCAYTWFNEDGTRSHHLTATAIAQENGTYVSDASPRGISLEQTQTLQSHNTTFSQSIRSNIELHSQTVPSSPSSTREEQMAADILGLSYPHPSITTPCQSSPTVTPTTMFSPSRRPKAPPEIQVLLDCCKSKKPVSMLVNRDSELLPFRLNEEWGCVSLGFFLITSVEETLVKTVPSPTEKGKELIQVCWTFRFEWTRGGELDHAYEQPSNPWWLPVSDNGSRSEPILPCVGQEATSSEEPDELELMYPTEQEEADVIQHRYTVLPPQMMSSISNGEEPSELSVSSRVSSRKGWHCSNCGKVNVQVLICFQRCSKCSTGNGAIPVGVMYARSVYGSAPTVFPWDRCPSIIPLVETIHEFSEMRTFSYFITNSIIARHLFTCNSKALQDVPNKLFREFQEGVAELSWQSVATDLAAGPYYTYSINFSQINTRGQSVPSCITAAKQLMETRVRQSTGTDGIVLTQLTVLGWQVTGNRKSPTPLSSKISTIAILALGADTELTIMPKSGYPDTTAALPEIPPQVDLSTPGNVEVENDDEYVPVDPMDLDLVGEECDLNISGAPPLPEFKFESISAPIPTRSKYLDAKSRSRDSMLFTLIHGDILVLSGDDFEWSLHRTGMGMVVIGMA